MKKSHPLTKREQQVEDWFELPMILVTIFLIGTVAIPLFVPLSTQWLYWLAILNLVVWSTFYIEFFTKLYVAKSKWRALVRNWLLLIIVVVPLFLPLRLMRISRLLGLVRVLRLQPAVDKLKKNSRTLVYSVEYLLVTLAAFVLTTGLMLWQVETRFDGTLTSLPDALWWALSTVTIMSDTATNPTSVQGQLVGVVMSVAGTMLLIVLVARVTAALIKKPA